MQVATVRLRNGVYVPRDAYNDVMASLMIFTPAERCELRASLCTGHCPLALRIQCAEQALIYRSSTRWRPEAHSIIECCIASGGTFLEAIT